MQQLLLSSGWQCKQRDDTLPIAEDFEGTADWLEASVPGVVHLDLLAAGDIPDPFLGLNENQVQWIGECDWLYRCHFDLPIDFDASLTLCFAGLDTFATVWLNGQKILVSDNMFVSQRVAVNDFVHAGYNELYILFESAVRHGQRLVAQFGQRPLWNGDVSRLYIRKAQYHYGWDWGPTLMTAGIWRAVQLESWRARIADLHCPVTVAVDLQSAEILVHVTLEVTGHRAGRELYLALYAPSGELVREIALAVTGNVLAQHLTVTAPQLWWPHSHGAQPLYRLLAILREGGEELDRQEQRLGLRRLQLIQQPLPNEPGTSFFFEINNTPIFCGGANWIPADSFLPRIAPERYRAWLELAAAGNLNMLRVWGGGIYEDDIFYDMCDELGLLVWQDFLFACGIYPADARFQASVRAEVEDNLRRLRHHPSIVLWCGNNEDYSLAESTKLYDPTFKGDFVKSVFPAREIYERLLPEICARLDPTRPYWSGSPYGGKTSGDATIGDTHIWTVWHGGLPYQDYPKLAGRFVSEFGMEAFPDQATIDAFASPEERYPQSRTLDHHNKDAGGPRRLVPYLIDNIRYTTDMAGYSYATRFIQSEALGAAMRGWRRRWQGPGHEYTAGALVWQLNDCWPVTSWAIVDYYLRPKPAYFTIKRELASCVVGLARSSHEQVAVWAVNGSLSPIHADLELRTWTLAGELVLEEHRPVEIAVNRAQDLALFESLHDEVLVVGARLLRDGEVLARTTLWPEPFKYLALPEPVITVERLDSNTVCVRTERPAKGVWLAAGEDVVWQDNMLDLMPGDAQVVRVEGLGDSEIGVSWLGM